MKVLSLFDGISCGRVALDRAGVQVDKYYASEVDKYAIQVAQKNYPDTVELGDVTKWREWDIEWSEIDLLIGGSPCQGFSFAGKQLAFDDPRSKLFFEYVDILNHIRSVNPQVKFLLENVRMKQEYLDVISNLLGVEPVIIDSNLVSAQNRNRYYWCSLGAISQPENKHILMKDIVTSGQAVAVWNQGKMVGEELIKSYCLLARDYKGFGNQKMSGVMVEGRLRKLTPIECERLQTLPDDYTAGVSNTQRYKALGNGWTVDVIAHIFEALK